MKTALICGAGGFIGGHLARQLKADGYFVRGVDLCLHSWSCCNVDEFKKSDLRSLDNCRELVSLDGKPFDEVYQLAADFGGMGYIESHATECLTNNVLINLNMLRVCAENIPGRYFYSSSACVYRDMQIDEREIDEDAAYPALPDNEYGWEKLFSERLAVAYSKKYGFPVRIARFQNCYGPNSGWDGGREKAPAALCRKAALARDGGVLEVWGDGSAIRNYILVDDLVNGIRVLTQSDETCPVNIGTNEYVNVDELANIVIDVSGKDLKIAHVPGTVGVQARNFSNARIRALGWEPKYSLRAGISALYLWIKQQVEI